MGRKRKVILPQQRKQSSIDLDNVPGTSETENNADEAAKKTSRYKSTEKIPPPFKGEKETHFVSWSDINLTWKVAALIGTLFLAVGVPVIWFSANMNSKIQNIGVEVVEIKKRMEKYFVMSIRNEERINNTDKTIDRIEKSINTISHRKPNN